MVLENANKSLTTVGSKVELNLNLERWRKKRGLEGHQHWPPADMEFICQFIEKADGKGEMLESIDHGDCEMTRGYAYTVIVTKPKSGVAAKPFTDWVEAQAEKAIRALNDQSHD